MSAIDVTVATDGVNRFKFPGLAYVEKAGNGYREIPLPWSPTI